MESNSNPTTDLIQVRIRMEDSNGVLLPMEAPVWVYEKDLLSINTSQMFLKVYNCNDPNSAALFYRADRINVISEITKNIPIQNSLKVKTGEKIYWEIPKVTS